ncbi:beta-glucuronosyltransferase GlcAT14B-like [Andrographis paniculata]|uniref:beta-glucuronosyltransferase GlcAT14B-like n=1 Tax=Andrographis paniculata TaxID=175694 RepID=UPI0021E6F5DC|nr:beta-glucuronosyltransferase GlcAT14B-like [Andrographis paniculata]
MGYGGGVERKWVFPIVITSLICVFLLATSFNMGLISSVNTINLLASSLLHGHAVMNQTSHISTPSPPPPPPKFAYLISGSRGDLEKLWRTLHVLYHPWNYYVVHLDLEAPLEERLELARRVKNHTLFRQVGNIYMNEKANMVTYRGPTMVSNTLHACAIFLRRIRDWDWFINLSASDYPLVTQDDLIHTFSSLERNLNFVEHTSDLGWKATERGMPLIVDPGLYERNKSDIFWADPKRNLPTAFKLFTGSAWTVLSRAFVDFCIWGTDNLPRTLLMYYTNFVSSPEFYFQTVICNSPRFISTVVNHDMHFISWDDPPQQHPRTLTLNDTGDMLESGAPFARKFKMNSAVLRKIDVEVLWRKNESFVPGGWCKGKPKCSKVGNPTKLRPGPGAERLKKLINKLMSDRVTQPPCT